MRIPLARSVPRTQIRVEFATALLACVLAASFSPKPCWCGIPDESPAMAQYQRAQELTSQGKWAEAVEPLQEYARANPSRTRAVIDLSRALLMAGNRNDAIAVLINAASSRGPKDRAALVRRVNSLTRIFKTNAVFQNFQDAVRSFRSGKQKVARDLLSQVLEQERDNNEVIMAIGQCYLFENDLDRAYEMFKEAQKRNPYDPEVKLLLGRVLYKKEKWDQATALLSEGAKDAEGSEQGTLWLAEALVAQNRRAEAEALLDTHAKNHPLHLEALLQRARLRFLNLKSPAIQPPVTAGGAAATLASPVPAAAPHPSASATRDLLWSTRKDAQLLLSRLAEYSPGIPDQSGHTPRLILIAPEPADRLRKSAETLLAEVDARIAELRF